MKTNRLIVSIISGMILGVFCIIGASTRVGGFSRNELFLFAMWFNRVVIGLVIGLAGDWVIIKSSTNRYLRGGILGLVISAAFFFSTGFRDVPAFFAGIVYGLIIEFVLWYLYEKKA